MRSNLLFALVLLLAAGEAALAQRPPRPQGPPPGGIGMPRDGRGGRPGEMMPGRPDGPPPTHERHCLNSVSLSFVEQGKALPDPLQRGGAEARAA